MKRILLHAAFALCLSTNVYAQSVAKVAAPKLVTTVEGIKEYELPNGLRVLLMPDASQTNIVVNIVYKVGSRHEGLGETGMAHLLEHMLFKQCKKFVDIKKAIADKGAQANGTTWYDRTNYYEILSASDENLRWAIDMEADRMVNSKILPEELAKEFSVVRNEFEIGENYPGGVLMERIFSTMYLWHNYGKSTIGSKEDIERVQAESLRTFYKKYYQPDNAILIIAGKFDENKALSYVQQYFGPLPRPTRKLVPTYTVEPPQDGEREVLLRRTGDVQHVALGYHTPALADKDFAANDALMEILTNDPSGYLYKQLVETKKAARVWSYSFGLYDPGMTYIQADVPKDKNADSVKQLLLQTMDRMSTLSITQEDLERAKNNRLKNLENTQNRTINFAIALTEFIGAGDWRLYFLNRDRMEKLTLADVKTVAANYYKPSNRTVGVFYPEATTPDRTIVPGRPDVAALLKDYKGKAAAEQKATFENTIANIQRNTEYGKLANGGKYALLQKPVKGDKITAVIKLRFGTESNLSNLNGLVPQMTAEMLKNGTATRSKKQIADELDKIKTDVYFYPSDGALNARINTDKANLDKALSLVEDLLRNPKFDEAEFERMKVEYKARYEEGMSDPQTRVFERLQKLTNNYPKGHPLYTWSTDESLDELKKVKLEDLKSFYTNFYGANNSVSTFVGEIEKEKVETFLKNTLGKWNSKAAYAEIVPRHSETKGVNETINTPDKTNAVAAGGINLQVSEKDADYPALFMANELLGGGAFLNSRIAQRLRENEGMSYGAGSFFNTTYKHQSGIMGVYAFFNPIYKNRLDSALRQEIDKALTKGFMEDELKKSSSSLMEQRRTRLGSNEALSGMINNYLQDERNLDDFTKFEEAVKKLTVAEVNAAIRKHVDMGKMVLIYGGDFDKGKSKPASDKKVF